MPTAQTAAPGTQDTPGTPADHVREAKQALNSIPTASLLAADSAKIAQIRMHLNALDRAVASPAGAAATPARGATASPKWATEVTALDKILTGLIGPDTATTADPAAAPTGTSGKSAAGGLNDQARTQLQIVRRHLTMLAAAMSGTTPRTDQIASTTAVPTSSPDMSASASQATAAAAATSTTPPTSATPPTTEPPATSSQTPATGARVDAAAAKQHLGEARDTLGQLTALPEAAKLQGDARAQVTLLIANFNELITTQSEWRASYAKVDANLTSLLGPDNGDQPAAAATDVTASGVAGATGTSGTVPPSTVPLDPAVRGKLVEFRTHLKAFEQAAGGKAGGDNAPAATTPTPLRTAATAVTPASGSMTPPVITTSMANPGTPTTGTSGTVRTEPTPTDDQARVGTATTSTAKGDRLEADQHLDAISEILKKAKNGTLDKAQTDELRMHVEQLRQVLKKGQ